MNALFVAVVVLLVAGVAIGAYALLAPRKKSAALPVADEPPAPPAAEQWTASTGWTNEAGDEFAGLSESARCDLIFAVSDLDDDRSKRLLVHALDDPSEAVAIAAAHALARRGCGSEVSEYAQRHPGERAQRILDTLLLLG